LEICVLEQKFCPCDSSDELMATFILNGRKIMVEEVFEYWEEPPDNYVRLLADDERIYVLRRTEGDDWKVHRIYSY
jgi:hypothetical protein